MSLRDIRRTVGQLLISGFDGLTLPIEMRALAREFDLGGLIIFSRNVEAPEQVAELSLSARELAREIPLWMSVDQEGGRVQRLKEPFTRWPPMATLGRAKDVALTCRFARALAAELAAVGITLDYAPVLDVLTNAKNPAIGDRALSDRAEDVALHGRAIIEDAPARRGSRPPEALSGARRHWCRLTSRPPHMRSAAGPAPRRRVRALPGGHRGKGLVRLTCHVLYPAIDEEHPATLSPRIVQALLREELGFQGAILTDDLDMKAIADRYTIEDTVVRAIGAGCDGVLICGGDYDKKVRALEGLIRAAEAEKAFARRLQDALARMRDAKHQFLAKPARRPDPARIRAALGLLDHQVVAEEMRQWL